MDARVLVVGGEDATSRTISAVLEADGDRVQPAATGAEAVAQIERTRYDVPLLDPRLWDEDGLARLRRRHEVLPRAAGIVLTGHGSPENAVAAMRAGADGFLPTPSDVSEPKASIARTLHRRARVAERGAQLARRDAEREAFRRASDERVGALEELNRLEEEFIAAASHAGRIRSASPGPGRGATFRFTPPTEPARRRSHGRRRA